MSWLKKRATAAANAVKDEHRAAGTPIDTIDMVEVIERVALEFSTRACVELWESTDETSSFCMPDMAGIFRAADKDDA